MTAATESAVEIELHPVKNTLYVDLTGRVTTDELEAGLDEILAATESLHDGFAVVTDLDGFDPVALDGAEPIERTRDALVERGMGRVVRVVGGDTSATVERAIERESVDASYDGETVESPAAAQRLLA